MNVVIISFLVVLPSVLSYPQYSQNVYRAAYRKQYEDQETLPDDSQFGRIIPVAVPVAVPVAPQRRARPYARLHKVEQPQPSTAAPQPERYTRPEPQTTSTQQYPRQESQLLAATQQYYRPEPQLITAPQQYSKPEPQLITSPQQYSRPEPQLITSPQQYSRPEPQLVTAPQEETYKTQYSSNPTQDDSYKANERYYQHQSQPQTEAPREEKHRSAIAAQSFSSLNDKYSRPADERHSTPIPIIKFDKSQSLDGSYKTSYETGNNIIQEETGFLKNIGVKDQEALVQQGSYSYVAPDGTVINTSYIADESGFRVEGSHLPTPPPVPEEIAKALEQIYEGIRLQQEAEAREAKYGKNKPSSAGETNSISDNYPNYS